MKHIVMLFIVAALCLSSCDGNPETDNGWLEVYNHTDDTIWVHYEEEVELSSGYVETRDREVAIPAGGETTIFVDTLLWDADVTVESAYGWVVYDIDFDLTGVESLHVYLEDFTGSAPGSET